MARPVEGQPHRRDRADVPRHLDVVAAGVGVVGQRRRVRHLGPLVVAVHQRELGLVDPLGGRADALGGDAEQQVGDRLVAAAVADELAHHAEPAGAGHDPRVGRQVSGDDAQQGRLARTVGADEGHLLPVPDPEADVVEEDAPVRQLVAHSGNVDMSHVGAFSTVGQAPVIPVSRRLVWGDE